MRLLSFVADGKEYFGAVSGDGVVTLNDKIGQPDLRAALAAGAMEAMRKAAQTPSPTTSSATSNSCRLFPSPNKILCAGVNYRAHAAEVGPRTAETAEHVHPLHRYAGRPRRRDDPAEGFRQFRFRGRAWRWSSARPAVTSKPSTRSITSPAIPASSTAACATTRNSPSPRARIFPAPGRSARGSSPPTKFPIRAG